jgi:hypothetical protein
MAMIAAEDIEELFVAGPADGGHAADARDSQAGYCGIRLLCAAQGDVSSSSEIDARGDAD